MRVIKSELSVSNVNTLNGYFPVRTKGSDDSFDWEVAQGIVVRNLYQKEIAKPYISKQNDEASYAMFSNKCKNDFENRVDDPGLWPYIEEMYFSPDAFYKIAPECLLFKITTLTANSSKNRLGDLFSSLMQGFHNSSPTRIPRNFLEQQVVDSLRTPDVLADFETRNGTKKIDEKPFLPFLTDYFCKDIDLLSNHASYLVETLEDFLKLYGYLYTAQLSLNINGFPTEPTSRPLYFILENETASLERTNLTKLGHQKVSRNIELIFPYLSMAETLQDSEENLVRLPLWELAVNLSEQDSAALKAYAEAFATQRELPFTYDRSRSGALYWLRNLLELSRLQFGKGQTRKAAQDKFIRTTELELCSTFVRSRGRVGKVLVMNQDYLTLLTNLAIGNLDRLRFHELIEEFNARGVYFDKQSQQSLINFYERVGNVERMSDGGDAVYVRKTI